jgi:polysaccharide export outer membrane protein
LVFLFALTGCLFAQTPEETPQRKNFGFSPNPKTRLKTEQNKSPSGANANQTVVEKRDSDGKSEANQTNSADFESRSVASKTLEVAKRANKAALSPTEIYKVGIGDVLFINLQNAPTGSTTYFTVLNDGTIDYPLAGEMVSVLGLMTDEIEDYLKEKIKVIENPQVSVRVREHASHAISVLGLVEKPGEKFLQREAVPLFVVRAEAIVKPSANQVIIRRANSVTETFDLNLSVYEDILIFPGDIVEFGNFAGSKVSVQTPPFYYIGGNVRSVGQKDFYQGITLTQAILASGGLSKSRVRTVIIRRKNSEGLLEAAEFNLNDIKDGKIPDPRLEAGDTIEVGN